MMRITHLRRRTGCIECLLLASCFAFLISATNVGATTIVAGFTFPDNAFPDVVLSTEGNPTFERILGPTAFDRIPTSVEDALLGGDLASMTIDLSADQAVSLGFIDNAIINRPGKDFVIFEEFSGEQGGTVQVEIAGAALPFSPTFLGVFDVLPGASNIINSASIDLSDFGFAEGQATQFVRITGTSSEIAVVVGAPIPEPSTMLLFGPGIAGLAALRWKKGKKPAGAENHDVTYRF